jgi:hypothetical protein
LRLHEGDLSGVELRLSPHIQNSRKKDSSVGHPIQYAAPAGEL